MKSKMTKKVFKTHTIRLLLAAVLFVMAVPRLATAKSLYLIADIGSLSDPTQPIDVYRFELRNRLTNDKCYSYLISSR